MKRIAYDIEERDTIMASITEAGQMIISDVTIGLVGGKLTNCYFEVIDAPQEPERPQNEHDDMLEAFNILGVEPEEG